MLKESLDRYFRAPAPRAHDAVAALREHATTQRLSQGVGPVREQGRHPMKGLTRPLRERFFPHYVGVQKRKSKGSSRVVGDKVHAQIHHRIECMRPGNTKEDCRCATKPRRNRWHRFTKQAFDVFARLELTPAAAEVPILSKRGGFATRLDVIAYRWKGDPVKQRSVILSIKTGYTTGRAVNRHGQTMEAPLHEVPCTPENHNQLQALCEMHTLETEYDIHFDDYILLYLGQNNRLGYHTEGLRPWTRAKSLRNKVFERLQNTAPAQCCLLSSITRTSSTLCQDRPRAHGSRLAMPTRTIRLRLHCSVHRSQWGQGRAHSAA